MWNCQYEPRSFSYVCLTFSAGNAEKLLTDDEFGNMWQQHVFSDIWFSGSINISRSAQSVWPVMNPWRGLTSGWIIYWFADGGKFCERGPTYRNRLPGGMVPPPSSSLLLILRPPHRKAAVSGELSANFSSLITKQKRKYILRNFLQTFNGTRRLRQACCISLTRSRRHGLLRAWFRAPVVPWMFTRRVAVVRAFRSVRATWWVNLKRLMASFQIPNPFVSLQLLPSSQQAIWDFNKMSNSIQSLLTKFHQRDTL